jgi:hypothetical protein
MMLRQYESPAIILGDIANVVQGSPHLHGRAGLFFQSVCVTIAHTVRIDSTRPRTPKKEVGTGISFQFRNEQFFARSRKSRDCAEAYRGTSHKRSRRLTPTLRKRAIYGWTLDRYSSKSCYIESHNLTVILWPQFGVAKLLIASGDLHLMISGRE